MGALTSPGSVWSASRRDEIVSVVVAFADRAIQVVDDVLDAEGSTATLGKTAGKDAQDNKPTYVSALGVARSKAFAEELRQNALEALGAFGERGLRLRQLADFIVLRKF